MLTQALLVGRTWDVDFALFEVIMDSEEINALRSVILSLSRYPSTKPPCVNFRSFDVLIKRLDS